MSNDSRILSKDQKEFVSYMTEKASVYSQIISRMNGNLGIDTLSPDTITMRNQNPAEQRHSPMKMIEFLSLFSKDDKFKWFTHKWDQAAEFDIDIAISNLKDNKTTLSSMAFDVENAINQRTYYQAWNFINFDNKDKFWTDNKGNRIYVGWHSIVGLCKENPGIAVENLKLEDGRLFKYYIRRFKSSIEFRSDLENDDRFSEFIWTAINDYVNGALNVEFSERFDRIGYDLNLYCDVPALRDAILTICDWIIKHKVNGTEVEVDLDAVDDGYILSITHIDSYFSNMRKLSDPTGDFDSLRKKLFSVVDLQMAGDYRENGENVGSITVNALDDNTTMSGNRLSACSITRSDIHTGGVKYIIKLYKKS